MDTFIPYIYSQHINVGGVDRVHLKLLEEGQLLYASSKKKEKNYGNTDIFLLLDHMNNHELSIQSLLRAMFYELSQLYTGSDLIVKIKNRAYDLDLADSIDHEDPVGLFEKIEELSTTKAESANYFSSILSLAEKNSSAPFSSLKSLFIDYLKEHSEGSKVDTRVEMIQEVEIPLDESFSLSPLLQVLSKVGTEDLFLTASRKEVEGKANDTNLLIPSLDEENLPLSEKERTHILGKLKGHLVVRIGREK